MKLGAISSAAFTGWNFLSAVLNERYALKWILTFA